MRTDWRPPSELPDLRHVGTLSLDTETKDEGLHAKRGPGWPWHGGYIAGISVAWRADGAIHAIYIPLRHPDSQNLDREQVIRWLSELIASGVKIVTKNGLYDWGWLWADLGIEMPPAEQLEEIDALATMVDENRYKYSLDALCAWRGFAGKDEALLLEGCNALGLIPARKRKGFKPQSVLWQLPAHYVGPYAETDAVRTLELSESLSPILDREGTREAYRLEIELLPMVHKMRRRGIRIDISAAEQAHDLLLRKRDNVLTQIAEKLDAGVGMDEINGRKWLITTFDRLGIKYPLTEKGNPSFKRGKRGWMQYSEHWLPPLIAAADQLDQYGDNFLQQQILGHAEDGRVYGEIHPHRSDYGGTRSLRFSYSHPPLQQMPKHDEELAPLIRSVFLPEEGETWASCDFNQQEFRLVVHYAARKKLTDANVARDRYINDPRTDFHAYASELTGGTLSRQDGKTFNFMTIYGAGPETTSRQLKKPLSETKALLALYNKKLPFISQLAAACKNAAHRDGFFTLFNHARRHFNLWAPGGKLQEGAGPCEHDEAVRRTRDPGHPWYGQRLWRAETYKALNVLIQSAAAVQTKEWMRACFHEGVVPLLQMHDSLDLSVTSPAVAEMAARLGEEIFKLEVPMKVDVSYGRTWGDAKHTWAELHTETRHHIEAAEEMADAQERTACKSPKLPNDSDAEANLMPAENITDTPPWEEAPLAAAAEAPSEPPHICIHCHRDPPDGNEQASAYNDAWLHPQCEEPFIRARMAEQGLDWQSASFAQATTPPPQSELSPPLPPPPPPPPPSPSTPSSGNGRGNGFAGFAGSTTGATTTSTTTRHGYPHSSQPKGTKVAEFIYRDLKGAPYLRVDKYVTAQGDKAFPQYRFENGQWLKRGKNWPSIPFHLPELQVVHRLRACEHL
jgi:DNA polymerase I-like protein with 3'-5' exonuclease and polymerase domains